MLYRHYWLHLLFDPFHSHRRRYGQLVATGRSGLPWRPATNSRGARQVRQGRYGKDIRRNGDEKTTFVVTRKKNV